MTAVKLRQHSRSSQAPQQLAMARRAPVGVAVLALLHGLAAAQPAPNVTSADSPENRSLFEPSLNQETIGPRPFTSFLDRLASPVDRISLKVAGDNLAADGITGTDVQVELLDRDGRRVRSDVDVTIEVDSGARILLPGRANPQTGGDAGDVDRIQPGVQYTVKEGVLQFKLIAPIRPEAVTLRVSVKSVAEKVIVRYVADLRELIAVGLLEGHLRSDKFDPRQIVPVRENDGFDNEIRNFNREFNGGKTRLGLRAAMYLKGKVRGDYLLTLAYDSEKVTDRRLFTEIDPNTFYPVYGDSSTRGVDAQSTGKLYVRLDKGRSYLMWGDYTTADTNVARSLSQYSRSLPGLRAHYEEGSVTANAFVARQSLTQIVDEFPARGVSGPYTVSRAGGIVGSEKIELLVRDRNQPNIILRATLLTRSLDYEFEPFDGRILFRAPVPSVDDQFNPVSIRVTYEVDQGGKKFTVVGGDLALKLTDSLTVGVAGAKDYNPDVPFTVVGANLHLRLSKSTELIAEVARAESVPGATQGNFTVNNSSNFAGVTGPVSGNAGRVELRHSGESLRGRVYGVRTDDNFNNSSAGVVGGRTDVGVQAAYEVTPRVTLNAEALSSKDRIADTTNESASVGADLKVTDRLTIGAGVRKVSQSASTLVPAIGSQCGLGDTVATNVGGYNVGFGINQVGNQQIDPATGRPVVCTPATLSPAAPAAPLDTQSVYGRLSWRATDHLTLGAELQRETGDSATTLYKIGADWHVADKTRVYGRYERTHQFSGAYGLGVGETASNIAVGVDTQYMNDGSVYSEYRLRDASAGREVQSAIGLRNGWRVAQGLRLVTNLEKLNSSNGDAKAASVGLEYTASEVWKASGRIEWREDDANTNWLGTVAVARKLDKDWTLLARDYFNLVKPRVRADGGTGIVVSQRRQNQFQLGMAWRPVDNNEFDAMFLYERKTEDDRSAQIDSKTDIVSLRANWHPSRPWWISGRYAFKKVDELLLGSINDSYYAQLFGARVSYDITNRWTLGAIATMLVGQGGARQYAYGLEVGFVPMDNVLLTLGYNWRGFSDNELAGGNYTNKGWVLGVRYKFDEELFKRGERSEPAAAPAPAPAAPAR